MSEAYFCTFATSHETDRTFTGIEIDVNQIAAWQEFKSYGKTYTHIWMRGSGNSNPFEVAEPSIAVFDAVMRTGEDDDDDAG